METTILLERIFVQSGWEVNWKASHFHFPVNEREWGNNAISFFKENAVKNR